MIRWAAAALIAAAPGAEAPNHVDLPEGAIAYLPAGLSPAPPLMVVLHGAGEGPRGMIARLRAEADRRGVVLLAPRAAGRTWDMVLDRTRATDPLRRGAVTAARLTVDPPRIRRAVAALSAHVRVDGSRVAIAGFSDGASYALTIGATSASLFTCVIAFSPGMAFVPAGERPQQRVFVAHGTRDAVLSYKATATRFVPHLRSHGSPVVLHTFDGGHIVPPAVAAAAFAYWLDRKEPA